MPLPSGRRLSRILDRLPEKLGKSDSQLARKPWRHRRRSGRKLSSEAKKRLKAARAQRAADLDEKLKKIEKHIWEDAVELREQDGCKHTVDYYVRLIKGQSTMALNRRSPSSWNAFLSDQLKLRNDGALPQWHSTSDTTHGS